MSSGRVTFMQSASSTSRRAVATLLAALVAGCTTVPAPIPSAAGKIVSLSFGSDYRGTESRDTELQGPYRLDLKCSGGASVTVSILVDRRSISDTEMPCEERSWVVSIASPINGTVTLKLEGAGAEGTLSMSAA